MEELIRRVDKHGNVEWHTLHEWNVINGYEKPDEIIPFIEKVDGEVVIEVDASYKFHQSCEAAHASYGLRRFGHRPHHKKYP